MHVENLFARFNINERSLFSQTERKARVLIQNIHASPPATTSMAFEELLHLLSKNEAVDAKLDKVQYPTGSWRRDESN
jgi:hypothetical protein